MEEKKEEDMEEKRMGMGNMGILFCKEQEKGFLALFV